MAIANQALGDSRVPRAKTLQDASLVHRTVAITHRDPGHDLDTVVLYVDGSFHQEEGIAVSGVVLKGNDGETYQESYALHPEADTSVETEAAAVLRGLEVAKKHDPSHIILHSDCKPVVERIQKRSRPELPRFELIYHLLDEIEFVNVHHIVRSKNQHADRIAHRGLREERERQKQRRKPSHTPRAAD